MFYAHFVLSKRGPLSRIWLAAHWDKKLTKAHVFETNLEDSVENIISPQVKMALRTSGHLLLGVVRIYNRKSKYLLADCNEAFVKIKMAFRPGVVDLPEENREAQHNQIYLVETFPNFDTPLPDITDIDMNRHLTLNQSRIDEITLPEEVPTSLRLEGFGGAAMEFGKDLDDRYSAGDLQNMFYKDDEGKDGKDIDFGMDASGMKGGFGGDMAGDSLLGGSFMQGPGLFGEEQDGGFLGEGIPRRVQEDITAPEVAEGAMDNQIMSPAPQPNQQQMEEVQKELSDIAPMHQQGLVVPEEMDTSVPAPVVAEQQPSIIEQRQEEAEETIKDQTTLVANEEEAFALEPLDIRGVKDMRMRRKRKLIVDHVMELDGQTMREQLKDFNDIVTTLDMAPPTKRLMQWKEMGGVDKLFSLPSKTTGDSINKIFSKNLHITIPVDLVDMTGTQLHEQFGDTTKIHDESSIHAARDERTFDNMSVAVALDQTNNNMLSQSKDPSMNQLNAPAGYNSDDDYEPYSVGPQSVASSNGDKGLGDIGVLDPTVPHLHGDSLLSGPPEPDLANLPETDMSSLPVPGSPGQDESYADDVDDLRWNKRTQHLLHNLQRSFKHEQEVTFFRMTEGITRKQAVSKFYSLLVLAKQEATILAQSQTFGDVYIRKGPKFDAILM
uniref:Double-strand-break repair protein rad21 homolog n=1 Tax=Phallusia mammillata TaxID=59560 RepID=A0A6F9DPM6_9ASCI|nr:double-strand-break repair protein rad21 homolog [Phallusia mammillata]